MTYTDKEDLLGSVYQVSNEGQIHLPMIGAVKVAGLNKQQAREALNVLFSEYYREPSVDIKINTTGRFLVLGEVGTPGVYYLQPSLTVLEAILNAGGYDKDNASIKSVMLMRGSPENPVIKRLNLYKMVKKGDRRDNLMVKPGDIVYVPKSFIASLERFKEFVYRYVSAYYGYGRLPAPPPVQKKEIILWDR